MKRIKHWTPRFIADRLVVMYYRRRYPDRPWLTSAAIEILSSLLRDTDVGIEFGSGRSTIWFARRVRRLTSVEHDEVWFRRMQAELARSRLENVDYHWIPQDVKRRSGDRSAYVKFLDRFTSNSVDFVLVDGLYRDHCALRALPLIRPGGFLVIDNVNTYLPSNSRAPNSRKLRDGPDGQTWAKVEQALSGWRRIWTSSGVWDTALFFRPCE